MRLGLSIRGHGYHPAAWRHPDVPADGTLHVEHYVRSAQIAARGKLDAGSPPLLQFVSTALAANTWFHLSVMAGLILLTIAAAAHPLRNSVMASVDIATFRAFNAR
jgi:hypothetical protein